MMNSVRGIVLLAHLGTALALPSWAAGASSPGAAPANTCRLILPDEIPAVVGHEISIYFDNVVLVADPHRVRFDVTCRKGIHQNERWTFLPKPEDVGDIDLTLDVYDAENRLIATAGTRVRVVPGDAGADRQISLLLIGDSLTHRAAYPEELLKLCKAPENPRLLLLGTHHVPGTSLENRKQSQVTVCQNRGRVPGHSSVTSP